ncbi:hypothetical protein [uncultured Psychroserpens sp.]|uniref:hypothetical protein n=1 Tax=uncultured Psychroserpens sp. TaxID=255436 RepID=UPI00263784B9|nr:hypothetical protein [uncultured Psychroserpens sp.]
MKKILIALLFVSFSINAQDAKVNSILKKHFKALNQTKLSTVNSLKIEGTFIQNGTILNLEIIKQRPDKWRRKIELNKTKMLVVINGNYGWEINQFAGANDPVDYDQAKLNAYSTSATIDNQLWYYKNNGAKIKYLTDEVVNEKKSIKLEITDVLGKTSHVWLDSKTYFINQTEDVESKQKLVYKEHQIIDGMYFPKKVSAGVYELEFSKIELNPKLDVSLFTKGDHMSIKDVTKTYLKAFYDLDYEKLETFYTDESFWFDPSTAVINPNVKKSIGKDKIIADLKSGFNGVQDAKYTFEKEFYSGPYVAIWGNYYYRIPAKFFQGMMHSDAVFEFNVPMVTNLVIKDGKVLEHFEYADWTDWAKQAQANAQKAK